MFEPLAVGVEQSCRRAEAGAEAPGLSESGDSTSGALAVVDLRHKVIGAPDRTDA